MPIPQPGSALAEQEQCSKVALRMEGWRRGRDTSSLGCKCEVASQRLKVASQRFLKSKQMSGR